MSNMEHCNTSVVCDCTAHSEIRALMCSVLQIQGDYCLEHLSCVGIKIWSENRGK